MTLSNVAICIPSRNANNLEYSNRSALLCSNRCVASDIVVPSTELQGFGSICGVGRLITRVLHDFPDGFEFFQSLVQVRVRVSREGATARSSLKVTRRRSVRIRIFNIGGHGSDDLKIKLKLKFVNGTTSHIVTKA